MVTSPGLNVLPHSGPPGLHALPHSGLTGPSEATLAPNVASSQCGPGGKHSTQDLAK